MMTAVALPH